MSTILDSYDPDIEERLHRELGAAILPGLDPLAVTAAAGQNIRRRRRALVASSSALVLMLGIIGFTMFITPTQPRPPDASPTISATSAVTARLEPLGGFETGSGPMDEVRLAVTWDPTATPDDNVSYATYGANGLLTEFASSGTEGLEPNTGTFYRTAGPGYPVIVGIMPASARWFTVVTPTDGRGGHASTSTQQALPGTPWQAFAVLFQDASDVAAVRDILWSDEGGTVRDLGGLVLPSVRLGDTQGTTVYVAADADVMGTTGRRTGGNVSVPLTGRPDSPYPVLSVSSGVQSRKDGLFAMLVPAGSTAPALTPGRGVTGDDPHLEPVPGTEWDLLWAEYATGDPATQAFSRVEWTGPGGERVTVTNY